MKTIESPCIHVCKIEDDACIGCGRTSREISDWLKYSDYERRVIMTRIAGECISPTECYLNAGCIYECVKEEHDGN